MSALIFSRRAFLKLATAALASRIRIPALTPPREPYVRKGEVVSYIGLAKYPAPVFIGATIVRDVGEWDGIGYPCRLASQGFDPRHPDMPHMFYDTDLACFRREIPHGFKWDALNLRRYPNVHALVREQRYGEDPRVTAAAMNLSGVWGLLS